jgi:uncharacterized membrane protein
MARLLQTQVHVRPLRHTVHVAQVCSKHRRGTRDELGEVSGVVLGDVLGVLLGGVLEETLGAGLGNELGDELKDALGEMLVEELGAADLVRRRDTKGFNPHFLERSLSNKCVFLSLQTW